MGQQETVFDRIRREAKERQQQERERDSAFNKKLRRNPEEIRSVKDLWRQNK